MRMIALVAVLGLLAPNVSAMSLLDILDMKQPNIHIGQLQLHPSYALTETYDSNIYLVPRDRPGGITTGGGVVGSWITSNALGLGADLPVGRLHHFAGNYQFESQTYSRQSEANSNIRQAAWGQYDFTGSHGLSAQLRDSYVNTTDQAFSELIQRQRRWHNDVGASATYAPVGGRLSGTVDYVDSVDKYLDPALAALLNRSNQSFGVKAGYKVQPKTQVFAAYHRQLIHYSVHRPDPTFQDKNNKAHNVDFGVEGDLTSRLTGTIMTGLTSRHYDEAPLGGNTRNTTNWTVGTNLDYKTQSSRVVLNLVRGLQESISGSNRYYITNVASIDAKHKLPHKFTAGVNLSMEFDKYSESQTLGTKSAVRRDDLYTEGASLQYDIQEWLTTAVAYSHRERDSIFSDQFNYEDHLTSLRLDVKF